ncbi:RAMP superfamily CRISPR-associated protein [Roseospira navarrensis]|uniref:Type III-B CRISPR module RAMP protein Cmr1 n=1 Tax=Roseospira navarrensis TaxID=140058 RepID=A0A7X1ZGF9_9PROT|nr:RAMP superfamily CRISPR-associated protein [Roseospira navarrensis]MQX37564.1 type III-B CRISPR module RAMP protein Cmr1 [Roseospira navarrensis]
MVQALRADFQVVTPLFLGGADQARAELRAPALKGLLRFWYRAADPLFLDGEAALFGAAAGDQSGQSAVLLHVEGKAPANCPAFDDFDPRRFTVRGARQPLNGLTYLGYPFQTRGRDARTAIPPGHAFALRCLLPRAGDGTAESDRDTRRALVAAVWLLGHFGAAGSRARRGFGGLALTGWRPAADAPGGGGPWPELEALPLAASAATVSEAEQALRGGLSVLRDWFPPDGWRQVHGRSEHPHLGPAFRYRLEPEGHQDWARVLAGMGSALQRFRVDMAPDDPGNTGEVTPARASFGLPLTFRYRGGGTRPITIVPLNDRSKGTYERHGSLLFLRLLPVGGRLHPLYVRMDGAVPGEQPPAAVRGQMRPLKPARTNAMDAFFDSLASGGGRGR